MSVEQWEYRTISHPRAKDRLREEHGRLTLNLERMGQQGWEAYHHAIDHVEATWTDTYFLKRPVAPIVITVPRAIAENA